ncbi:MAG: C13 family peptidase [Myxococcota bacterium]
MNVFGVRRRAAALMCFLCACDSSLANEQQPCVAGEVKRIGVLWPGPTGVGSAEGWRKALDWALENVNAYAERTGFCLRTLTRQVDDTDPESLQAVAKDLAEDDVIQAVIGPTTSSQVMDVAGVFLKAEKPFVAPSATAGELARVTENEPQRAKFVWRTVGSDVMRARAAAAWIAAQGWSRVALVAARESKAVSVAPLRSLRTGGYGDTYADWMGIFAGVSSIRLTSLRRADAPFSRRVCRALVRPQAALLQERSMKKVATRGKPLQKRGLHDADVLVVAASSSQDIACVVQAAREVDGGIPVLVTESRDFCLSNPSLCHSREGGNHLYTIMPTALPDSGFLDSYRQRFGEEPPAYAAQVYDAVLWVFYGIVRENTSRRDAINRVSTNSAGFAGKRFDLAEHVMTKGAAPPKPRSGLADAMRENARRQRRANSTPVHWGKAGIGRAVQALQTGRSVRLSGAGGALTFDPDLDIDPTTASYRLDRVAGDTAVPLDVLTVRVADDGNLGVTSLFARASNDGFMGKTRCSEPTALVNEDTRVLLLSSSYGWRNYRHQSDLLAVRDWLLAHGADEKHMVTIAADDLAEHSQNPDAGSVINRSNGVNLHQADGINYRLCGDETSCSDGVTVSDVLHILAGGVVRDKCLREPCAVGDVSEQNDGLARSEEYDLFIYLTGHAGAGGLYFNHATAAEPGSSSPLSSQVSKTRLPFVIPTPFVIPAKRAFQKVETRLIPSLRTENVLKWIPAFAGMTGWGDPHQDWTKTRKLSPSAKARAKKHTLPLSFLRKQESIKNQYRADSSTFWKAPKAGIHERLREANASMEMGSERYFQKTASQAQVLRPEDLADVLRSVSARRVFLAVDTCHAGVFGEEIARRALPNVVVFSATRKNEVSFSEFFDPRLRTPLGNQFTARWLDVLWRTPAVPLPSMAWQVARGTLGSHVELYNALRFSGLGCTRLARPSF